MTTHLAQSDQPQTKFWVSILDYMEKKKRLKQQQQQRNPLIP